MVLHDRIWRRRQDILNGQVYADLEAAEREQIVRLLGTACNILADFGATDPETLIRMCHDEQVPSRVNEWVAAIIATV
jgi:hypothetical protein